MFAFWLRNNPNPNPNPNPKNLPYYFANNALNEAKLQLIAKIVKDKGHHEVPVWPGIKIGMSETGGEILLGT